MGFARAGAGFGASARIPISPSLIADKYPIGVRTRMFAFENLGRPLGLVVGPFFVGAVAAEAGGAEGWRWAMVAIAIPALFVALVARCSSASRRGASTSRKPCSAASSTHDDEPPVRLSSVAARLKKVKTFRYLTLGIGMLGFALVSVPVRLSFLFDETYDFDAYKRGWVLSLTYIPALLVIPIAGRYGDRLFRRDPRWAVRLFGWLVVGVRRVPHGRDPAQRGRAADRVRRDRQRVPARGVHADRPDDLGGRAVPDARRRRSR